MERRQEWMVFGARSLAVTATYSAYRSRSFSSHTKSPRNRRGAPIGPSMAPGNPDIACRLILPAFLKRSSKIKETTEIITNIPRQFTLGTGPMSTGYKARPSISATQHSTHKCYLVLFLVLLVLLLLLVLLVRFGPAASKADFERTFQGAIA